MTFATDFNNLFGALPSKYCDLFYGISVLYFILMIMAIVSLVFLFRDYKRNKYNIMPSVLTIVMLGVNYIYQRLLFNMCTRSN